ncbi:MAG: O-antigen ligase family protein [Arthrobacter sp.]|nr:O-antigen ligase family protein [Arthrobacter sp.]
MAKFGQLKGPDAVTVITWYAVLLYVVPADRRIEALGGAGSPAYLLAIVALLWWAWHRSQRPAGVGRQDIQWVRTAAFVFVAACVASYTKSALTALPYSDVSVADLGLIRVGALVGILLVANDGITSEERFMVLVRRLTMFAGLYAGLGLVQFFTGLNIVDTWQIPGLSVSGNIGIGARAGFVRAAATAAHPLEYAVVLSMMLPFCLTVAIYDRSRSAFLRWLPVAAITLSSVLSVSRSALISLAAVFLILVPSWAPAIRRSVGFVMALGAVAVYVAVPGMAGTIVGMFSGSDSSVMSRTDSYDDAVSFFLVSPFFGRGFGTFLPAYRILDNQYLGSSIEIGLVGLSSLLAVIVSAMAVAGFARRHGSEQPMRPMGLALVASMVAGGLGFAFFDAFAFPQACGTLFLVAGICGAYANLQRTDAAITGRLS